MSLVAVLGATGQQGGSVANILSKNPKYKVRALTRNVDGNAAKKLASQGIEVVPADVNDETSIVKAFKGVECIFAVTAFWPSAFTLGFHGAGEEELQQIKNIATAASQTPTLKHLVLSTLPNSTKLSGGKFPIPHYDYKQKAVDWIRAGLPDLWAKTTEFWPGWYTSNLISPPYLMGMIPAQLPGAYYMVLPSKPEGKLPIAGNLQYNAGVVVEALFDKGEGAFGKIAILVTDYLPVKEVPKAWAAVTGKRAAFVEASDESFAAIWGPGGTESSAQLRWSEEYPDWHAFEPERVISFEELGIEKKIVGFYAALEAMKDELLKVL